MTPRMPSARRRRRLRWIVPATVVAGIAGAAALPRVLPAGADPVPVLPPLTAAQLLDKVRTTNVTTMSGDIRFTTRLGLPDLSALGGGRGATFLDLLSGTHVAHVWADGSTHLRLAIDSPQSESDWIRNGNDLWSWDSSSQSVQHAVLPDDVADAEKTADKARHSETAADATPAVDPATAAQRLLAEVDPTTKVDVRTPGYVAGRAVYELVVAPRSSVSTIAEGTVAVDAATGTPLAVRVLAKDSSAPAVEIAFTSISFDKPSASTFAFAPPAGATVTQVDSPSQLLPLGSFRGRHHDEGRVRDRVNGTTAAQAADTSASSASSARNAATRAQSHVKTVGTAWDSVAIISGVPLGRQLQPLIANAPTVTVGSQSAKLIATRLVNVLVLDDGRIAVGAVTPDALAAAAATA